MVYLSIFDRDRKERQNEAIRCYAPFAQAGALFFGIGGVKLAKGVCDKLAPSKCAQADKDLINQRVTDASQGQSRSSAVRHSGCTDSPDAWMLAAEHLPSLCARSSAG